VELFHHQSVTENFLLDAEVSTQLIVNNISISIIFDFRMQIIQRGTVAMAPSTHGRQ
jgi:hypothetical protein